MSSETQGIEGRYNASVKILLENIKVYMYYEKSSVSMKTLFNYSLINKQYFSENATHFTLLTCMLHLIPQQYKYYDDMKDDQ